MPRGEAFQTTIEEWDMPDGTQGTLLVDYRAAYDPGDPDVGYRGGWEVDVERVRNAETGADLGATVDVERIRDTLEQREEWDA